MRATSSRCPGAKNTSSSSTAYSAKKPSIRKISFGTLTFSATSAPGFSSRMPSNSAGEAVRIGFPSLLSRCRVFAKHVGRYSLVATERKRSFFSMDRTRRSERVSGSVEKLRSGAVWLSMERVR